MTDDRTPEEVVVEALDAAGAEIDGQGLPPWSDKTHRYFSEKATRIALRALTDAGFSVVRLERVAWVDHMAGSLHSGDSPDLSRDYEVYRIAGGKE